MAGLFTRLREPAEPTQLFADPDVDKDEGTGEYRPAVGASFEGNPIAEFVGRIRGAMESHQPELEVPASKLRAEVARMLQEDGLISNYTPAENNGRKVLRIYLDYRPKADGSLRKESLHEWMSRLIQEEDTPSMQTDAKADHGARR